MCGRSGAGAASLGTDRAAVALIARDARAERLECTGVVHLAFHECFERRQSLPEEGPR
jgi:hypothetical protein